MYECERLVKNTKERGERARGWESQPWCACRRKKILSVSNINKLTFSLFSSANHFIKPDPTHTHTHTHIYIYIFFLYINIHMYDILF